MTMIQEKLNVKVKTKSNVFNWRGQFTPQFVDYILDFYSKKDDMIVDPFSGSGTVLHESSKRELNCYGFEINPAAYVMSKFFSFSNLNQNNRIHLLNSLNDKLQELYNEFNVLPLYIEKEDYRESYVNFLNYSIKLKNLLKDKNERIIALNLLFIAENFKKVELNTGINKAYQYIKNLLLSLPLTEYVIDARLNDARSMDEYFHSSVNLILTSPPYINVFNYHQNHRAIIELYGFNILKVAESEFGSNRKNRGNRFKTVIQYCLDMELAFDSFWRALKIDGIIVLVIGRESNVRKTKFYNGKIIMDLIERTGSFSRTDLFERAFINKFGSEIKEDIIVLRKTEIKPKMGLARIVAKEHLISNLENENQEIRKDIEDAIMNIDKVLPSPILNKKSIIAK